MATAAAAARSNFRSSSLRCAATRATSQAKSTSSPFRIGNHKNSLSNRLFRCAHLLPSDDEAFEHYNIFSAKRLDESWNSHIRDLGRWASH